MFGPSIRTYSILQIRSLSIQSRCTTSLASVHNYCLIDADRDAIGEAFEVFIGPALRGSEGQFFTPRNVVEMVIDIVQPRPGEMIIDPACGSGGFLIVALGRVWRALEEQGARSWMDTQTSSRDGRPDAATRYFRGIDKDAFLARVTKAYMAIVGDGRGGVFCENSLKQPHEWDGLLSRSRDARDIRRCRDESAFRVEDQGCGRQPAAPIRTWQGVEARREDEGLEGHEQVRDKQAPRFSSSSVLCSFSSRGDGRLCFRRAFLGIQAMGT